MSSKVGGEYGNVRANIDVHKLEIYLKSHLPKLKLPLDVKQFKFGQSNPTYFVTDSNNVRYVLRKKPAGALLSKTAHQVEREYTILAALHKHNCNPKTKPGDRVPVPEPYLLCEDTSVIGTAFYVMEFLEGRIFQDVRVPELQGNDRAEVFLAAVQALTALSRVNPFDIGLGSFGPNSPYFPRQLKAFSKIAEAQSVTTDVDTGERVMQIPYYDEMRTWYATHLPDENKYGGLRIVHGDYKLDNMIFHPTENRVIGILDWELCTLGSPLADFANLTQPWSIDPANPLLANDTLYGSSYRAFKNQPPGPEVPVTLDVLETEYCRRMGYEYPIKDMGFVRSWMLFRGSIILQGIAARAARRQASSENPGHYVSGVETLGKLARDIALSEGGNNRNGGGEARAKL
ncbi:hypothetical protein D9758_005906 [Tetrapyrgos nigripes]|uniref:Aminoglycoside phosphotransferase domain-containing protein n=1 Tax=Tetrapyrgos nigripes TaxID=182062 RepID=A0A8H5G2V9_9AGAR|nr:hypothetical protein D9758_005906 [Tetrapyrgos nigripes]